MYSGRNYHIFEGTYYLLPSGFTLAKQEEDGDSKLHNGHNLLLDDQYYMTIFLVVGAMGISNQRTCSIAATILTAASRFVQCSDTAFISLVAQ